MISNNLKSVSATRKQIADNTLGDGKDLANTTNIHHKATRDANPGASLDGTEAEAHQVEKTELWDLALVEPEISVPVPPSVYDRNFINPLPQQVPAHILGRPILVATPALTLAAPSFTNSALIDAWYQNPAITKALVTFNWIRASFSVKLLLRASPSVYGLALVSWYFGPTKSLSIPYLSSASSQIIDVAAAEAVEVEIPFVYAKEYLTKPFDFTGYFTYTITLLNVASVQAGVTPQIDAQVFISAHDVDVGGYLEAQSLTSEILEEQLEFQSKFSVDTMLAAGVAALPVLSAVSDVMSMYSGQQTVEVVQGSLYEGTGTTQDGGFPMANAAVGIKQAYFGNLNSLDPQRQMAPLTEFNTMKRIDPSVACGQGEHRLDDVVANGTIVGINTFTPTAAVADYALNSAMCGLYYEAVSQHFRYMRGRLSLMLHFCTSPLQAARFTIQWHPISLPVNEAPTSDVPSHTVLVRGFKRVHIEIPYHQEFPIMECGSTNFGYLRIIETQLVTPFASGVTPQVFCYTTGAIKAAQFFSMQCVPGPTKSPVQFTTLNETDDDVPTRPPKLRFQSLRQIHREQPEISFSECPHIKTDMYPSVQTVEEICKRWTRRELGRSPRNILELIGPSPVIDPTTNRFNDVFGDNLDKFQNYFALYRGGREFRVKPGALTGANPSTVYVAMATPTSQTSTAASDPANGTHIISSNVQLGEVSNVVEYVAPYLNKFKATDPTDVVTYPEPINSNMPDEVSETGETAQVYSRATEDLQFFWLNNLNNVRRL